MTKPISAPRLCFAVTILLFAWILFPGTASALPSYCDCPPAATSSVGGTLNQMTCANLETNLYSNLRSYAASFCGSCGACFYSGYTTYYPSCYYSDGWYSQSGTLPYACGFSTKE